MMVGQFRWGLANHSLSTEVKSVVGDYYNVYLSDDTIEVCKLCEFIDGLPVFKTVNNRFLYFDGGKDEFPNRYMNYTEVVNKTMYKRDDILTTLLNEAR